jgi:predicted SpoU family rRNA methylase
MINYRHIKKIIAIIVIAAFFSQMNLCLHAQSEGEIVRQFQRAKERYLNGQYVNAKTRIERIISIIIEKDIPRGDILGGCYLLLGAIYEKEDKSTLAEENYQKAKETYGIMLVEGVDLDPLSLYRKIVKGEREFPPGMIEKEGDKKKKKFPWLLVVGGAVVVGALVYFFFLKPKKKTLTVNLEEGVEGEPASGTYEYKKGEVVSYNYRLQAGYSQLSVLLDGVATSPQGTVTMNGNHRLTASATLNVVDFVTDRDRVDVGEGNAAAFNVKLSAQPQSEINVTVSHVGGDSDISVLAGGSLIFTPTNWDTYQAVTLQAAEDQDAENGEATIRLSAPGIAEKDITAAEVDNDNLRFEIDTSNKISIGEGATASFRVRISAQPSSEVTAAISRVSGDNDINVQSPRTLTFTPEEWDKFQRVTLEADQDTDTINGTATIRVSAPGIANQDITVTEIDDDVLQFVVDADEPIEIEEGGTASFQVKLSAEPSSEVTASVSHLSGDSDITVDSGSTLTFTPNDWDTFQTVTLAAAQDDDIQSSTATFRISAPGLANRDIEAKEIDDDGLQFVTDVNEVTVPEEQTASFKIKLSALPSSDVTARVTYKSGDSDISVLSGSPLTFTTDNWDTYQTVTLQADKDEDEEDGQAIIEIGAIGMPVKTITAKEQDNGSGEPPEVSISNPQDGETICNDITIQAVASDDFGIQKVEFYIDNALVETDTVLPYRYVWSIAEVTPGPHQIKVIAYDDIDQTAEDEISVTVADDPPTVEITPPGQSPLSGAVTFSVRAEDCGGVQEIQIFVDGDPLTSWDNGPQTEVDFNFPLNTTAYSNGNHIIKAVAIDTSDQESEPAEITVVIEN